MDVSVVDEDGEMNSGPVAYDERGGTMEEVGLDAVGCSTSHDEDGVAEPCVGMEFDSEDVAKAFYDEYARRLGFRSKFGRSSCSKADATTIARDYVCAREGVKRRSGYGCNASLSIEFKGQDKWIVVKFVREHNHSLLSPGKVHSLRPRRHFASASKGVIEPSQVAVPNGVMYISADGNRVPTEATHGNRNASSTLPIRLNKNSASVNYALRPNTQQRTLGRDAQNLLEYFKKMQAENPGFFYAIQLDEDNCMTNVFWADSRSRAAYRHFGDTITLDTSYRINQYRVPFAPFIGVNHHGHNILFGCALLLDESEASFIWLLKTFLTAMNDQRPSSVTTDQDRALQIAVAHVFPEARHCVSKWHVLREGQEKLAHVCHIHPTFQMELYNCINLTETIEEFESAWSFILDKYHLRGHTWLEALYNSRAQWVPAYFRDSFFAVISPNQRYKGSFFDGFVNQQTTLPMFFRQYERALERCFEKELEADVETICSTPVLKTPSPMEKQAANLYTRRIFVKFQEELVETFVYTANRIEGDEVISTFQVAKFEDDQKAYMVTFNQLELRASCSCQMFEYSGMLCRHILTVFTVTNVLTLPSHYILKRWTRNAKTSSGTEERVGELSGLESFTIRYNNLCQEAIRYAEEGAVALETYNAAMGALREVGKKILVVKKNVAKVASSSMQAWAVGYDERKAASSASDTAPLLWPQQDEVMRRFNLNGVVAAAQSVADLNLPCMAHVSLKQDESSPGNMASLPCLKSMTWLMENKNSSPGNRVAVISLKLLDNSKIPSMEMEVKFQLSKVTLEPMLRSMAYISDQLSTPANRVAVINLKLQDTETISGESEVRFQVSRDTLGAMLRSMAYIREQLSNVAESQLETPSKKQRK